MISVKNHNMQFIKNCYIVCRCSIVLWLAGADMELLGGILITIFLRMILKLQNNKLNIKCRRIMHFHFKFCNFYLGKLFMEEELLMIKIKDF